MAKQTVTDTGELEPLTATAVEDEPVTVLEVEPLQLEKPTEAEPTVDVVVPVAPAPTFKFKTLEEYDTAYKEAERKMHEATESASASRKNAELYETAIATLSGQLKAAAATTGPDPVLQAQDRLAKTIEGLDFSTDPAGAAQALAQAVTETSRTLSRLTMDQERRQHETVSATETRLKERLKPLQLDGFYEDLFVPTVDRLWKSPVFQSLPDEIQFSKVVEEMQRVIASVRGPAERGASERADKLKAAGSLGRGGALPMTPAVAPEDQDLGNFKTDMKAMRTLMQQRVHGLLK